jgi:hypothetical protein
MFKRLLGLCNDVGPLVEEYDTKAERLVGNVPQAFNHVPLIDTARTLSVAKARHIPDSARRRPPRFRVARKKRPRSRSARSAPRRLGARTHQVLVRMTSCWVARVIAAQRSTVPSIPVPTVPFQMRLSR